MVETFFYDDPSIGHKDNGMGRLPGKTLFMGDRHHGHSVPDQIAHHIQHDPNHFRVQGQGRLVKQHGSGLDRKGTGDGHPLPLTAGKMIS